MNVKVAKCSLGQRKAIAVCFVHIVLCLALQFKRIGDINAVNETDQITRTPIMVISSTCSTSATKMLRCV